MFGTRFLTEETDVFEHNAWDRVEWDEEQKRLTTEKIAANSSIRMQDEKQQDLDLKAAEYWDRFYEKHQNRFFKDRHWLFVEFPELDRTGSHAGNDRNGTTEVELEDRLQSQLKLHHTDNELERFTMLECGCGVGNTVIPILQLNKEVKPPVMIYCCDFSETAISTLKQHEDYDQERCHAFVLDATMIPWNAPFESNSLDVITMVFTLSAIHPSKMQDVINEAAKFLKPGGLLLFRDYGRLDLAQVRFKLGQCLQENFYARNDGTRAYFFDADEVDKLLTQAGLVKEVLFIDRRLQVNRGKQLKMYRVWIQAKYRKSASENQTDTNS